MKIVLLIIAFLIIYFAVALPVAVALSRRLKEESTRYGPPPVK